MHLPDNREIEEAALRAWPAAQQLLFDGWVVRLSDGYTKRANSATLLYPVAGSESDSTISRIEATYRSASFPVIFRLLSFTNSSDLDARLAGQGFREADRSLVMSCRLTPDLPLDPSVRELEIGQGIEAHASMNNLTAEHMVRHRGILDRVPGQLSFSGLFDRDDLVSCGLSVTDGPLVGLFDIVTSPAHRQKGYAARLVQGMLSRAAAQGVSTAYLQVVMTNVAAINLYESLGFGEAYRYAYRILD